MRGAEEVIGNADPTGADLAVPPRPRRRPRPLRKLLGDFWQSRELLRNLVARDLKIRYKDSILGFAWSMVTPLATVLVFGFIFTRVFEVTNTADFSLFFLAGFLPWQFLSGSIAESVGAIVGNGPLMRQVNFPREYLPLSKVSSQAIHFVLSLGVLSVYALVRGYNFFPFLPVLALAILFHALFVAGMSMAFAAANVAFRDLQELVPVMLLLWFYGSPLFYRLEMVPAEWRWLILLNPMTWFLDLYRHVFYYLVVPPTKVMAVAAFLGVASTAVGYLLFVRLARTFSKEL
ncbi:MAG TPA: ABC transporter permease [Actinomycetota bacterium]|nr:ABC transporter permease [Actinomycetota bacterium]